MSHQFRAARRLIDVGDSPARALRFDEVKQALAVDLGDGSVGGEVTLESGDTALVRANRMR